MNESKLEEKTRKLQYLISFVRNVFSVTGYNFLWHKDVEK